MFDFFTITKALRINLELRCSSISSMVKKSNSNEIFFRNNLKQER